jgi:uncharacterized protein (DUF2062 family)
LRDVVTRALKVHDQVLVVDDGSTDAGANVLQGLGVQILRHPGNRGKGAAIVTAAREARRLGMSHIVTMDADGQHDPADFLGFLPLMKKHPHAIVVGKRILKGPNVPKGRRFHRGFSNFWFRVQTGRPIGDSQSGYRAYPIVVFEKLKLREKHYTFEVEVLVKAAWAGVELLDLDIPVYYPPARDRVSHFRLFMDNLRLTDLNTRLTIRSMIPWPHPKIRPTAGTKEKITLFHPIRSLRRLMTGENSPARLGAAGALGVFLGTLPLIAFHTMAILFAAGYLRLNKIAAVAASQLCMPPLVPALCIEVGYFVRHGKFLTEVSLETLGYQALERIFEWVIGSLLFAPVLAALVGGVVYIMAFFVKWEKGIRR